MEELTNKLMKLEEVNKNLAQWFFDISQLDNELDGAQKRLQAKLKTITDSLEKETVGLKKEHAELRSAMSKKKAKF